MALSKDEKDALNEHFRDKDIYDPTKDPEQEVSTFEPKGLFAGGSMGAFCDGGTMGYADGGDVPQLTDLGPGPSDQLLENPVVGAPDSGGDDFAGPSISDDTTTARGTPPDPVLAGLINKISPPPALPTAVPAMSAAAQAAPRGLAAAPVARLPLPGSSAPPAQPQAAPAGAGKLGPSEYDELIKALQPGLGQRLGQGAFSALGGLADAIETGVARGSSPGFQKGIDERAQNQRQNLINALREKYETGFKGAELKQGQERIGQEGQRIKNEAEHNKATEAQSAAMLKFDQDREKINSDLEAGKINLDEAAKRMEAAQKGSGLFNAIGRKLGYGPPLPAMPGQGAPAVRTVHTRAEWAALPKGTPYQDKNGKPGIKQ